MPTGSTGSTGSKSPTITQVTNTYHVNCKANSLMPALTNMNSSMTAMNSSISTIQSALSSMTAMLVKILDVQMHIHNCHWHGTTHYSEQGVTGVEPGMVFFPNQPDEINLLLQESQSGIDKDGNGLVYCSDFIISDNDSKKPSVLRDTESHFKYDGIALPRKSMSWQSYLKTLPWCNK